MKKIGMIIFAAVLPLAFAFSDEDGNKEAQAPEIKLNIELQKPGYGEGGGSGAAGLPHAGTLPAPEEMGSTAAVIPQDDAQQAFYKQYTGKLKIKGKNEKRTITLKVKKDRTYTLILADEALSAQVNKLKNKNVTVTACFDSEQDAEDAKVLRILDCSLPKKTSAKK